MYAYLKEQDAHIVGVRESSQTRRADYCRSLLRIAKSVSSIRLSGRLIAIFGYKAFDQASILAPVKWHPNSTSHDADVSQSSKYSLCCLAIFISIVVSLM